MRVALGDLLAEQLSLSDLFSSVVEDHCEQFGMHIEHDLGSATWWWLDEYLTSQTVGWSKTGWLNEDKEADGRHLMCIVIFDDWYYRCTRRYVVKFVCMLARR
jgi:hypothetical protein